MKKSYNSPELIVLGHVPVDTKGGMDPLSDVQPFMDNTAFGPDPDPNPS